MNDRKSPTEMVEMELEAVAAGKVGVGVGPFGGGVNVGFPGGGVNVGWGPFGGGVRVGFPGGGVKVGW